MRAAERSFYFASGIDMADKKSGKKKTSKKSENVVKENSLVYVDYVGRTKEDGEVFDLTLEDVAKEEGVYKEDDRYEPMLVAVGWNWLLKAIEDELVGMKVGEKKTVEVPPEKGAGPRDPKKVKKIAIAKLAKQGIQPIKGEKITFGQERGVITSVLGRTVRVDFNSPLAGKTLVFDVIVREIVTGKKEKMKAVVKRRIPALPDEKFEGGIRGKTVTIELPKETRYIENIQYAEIGIAADLLKVFEQADEVKMVVTFERPEEPKEADSDEE
ncbi:peptidylprolyl isomerase [Candidatus Thorarchaeota archaeon]|nr:MAG: peptidylprolyl isomerase [Candidatus Thorarchaeota archaeon]